jgi:hypothetical protein
MVARMAALAVSEQHYIGDLYSNPVTGHGGTRTVTESTYESAVEALLDSLSESSEDRCQRIDREVEDLRFQRDMERYERIRAEAQRCRDREEAALARAPSSGTNPGNVSDTESELSMLASNFLNRKYTKYNSGI